MGQNGQKVPDIRSDRNKEQLLVMSHQLSAQKDFLAHAVRLRELVRHNDLGEQTLDRATALEAAIRDCELVIPVVGAFSSGKSTMLNTLLGERRLPTAIRPETSIATELRYAEQPYLEAVGEDGAISRFEAEAFGTVSENAASWAYIRLYLNNRRLKEIEPLVLVDMPGFDSPLEQHNRAIVTYLLRGSHYFLLCDAQEGTLSKTLLRHMHDIEGFDRGMHLFLSKTDLKPQCDIEKITAHIRELLDTEFDNPVPLGVINNTSIEAVNGAIAALDPDGLFRRIHTPGLEAFCNELLDTANLKLRTLQKSREQLDAILEELRDSLKKLKTGAEADIEHMRRAYSTGMTGGIIKAVGRDLSLACGELVTVLASGNQPQAEARLNEIVRSSLLAAIRDKLGEVNTQICNEFSMSLEGMDHLLKQEEIDEAFVERLSQKVQTAFTDIQAWLQRPDEKVSALANLAGKGTWNMGAKVVGSGLLGTSLLGATAGIAMPVIGALLLFLPEILGAFFKNANRENVNAAIRGKLEGEVFPAIKSRLRDSLPARLEEQVGIMIEAARNQYEALIAEKMNIIRETAEGQNAERQEQERKQQALEAARNEVMTILNDLASCRN